MNDVQVKIGTVEGQVRLGLWRVLKSADGGADRSKEIAYVDLQPKMAMKVGSALSCYAVAQEEANNGVQATPANDSDSGPGDERSA